MAENEVEVLRPRHELLNFTEVMEGRLRAHDDRPGWVGEDLFWLMSRLEQEARELRDALSAKQFVSNDVINECADVANFAMMIADNAYFIDRHLQYIREHDNKG